MSKPDARLADFLSTGAGRLLATEARNADADIAGHLVTKKVAWSKVPGATLVTHLQSEDRF
jgi:hypothetical protein